MMGGLSLNASGAALDSSFGVFEVAHGACCDAGRQVEAQQGAGRSADAGEFSTAAEGRHKPPPSLYKSFIAHVEGGAAAHISSMTSSWFDPQSDWEGRDGERALPLRLVCGWTMNSWVFGSISLLAKVSPS